MLPSDYKECKNSAFTEILCGIIYKFLAEKSSFKDFFHVDDGKFPRRLLK